MIMCICGAASVIRRCILFRGVWCSIESYHSQVYRLAEILIHLVMDFTFHCMRYRALSDLVFA